MVYSFFRQKKKREIEMAPIETRDPLFACIQKLQTKRYPLKFNLHKKQFVSLCFVFALAFPRYRSRFDFRHCFSACFFFSIFKWFEATTNYVIILYFIWNEIIAFFLSFIVCNLAPFHLTGDLNPFFVFQV